MTAAQSSSALSIFRCIRTRWAKDGVCIARLHQESGRLYHEAALSRNFGKLLASVDSKELRVATSVCGFPHGQLKVSNPPLSAPQPHSPLCAIETRKI